jgi:DNA-binding transcriptional ArsR family regulator
MSERQREHHGLSAGMTEPELREVPMLAVLQALADETRLTIVRELAAAGDERLCGTFAPGLAKATRSHHFKVLREAGLTRTRMVGTSKYVRLRGEELGARFPGLLESILAETALP